MKINKVVIDKDKRLSSLERLAQPVRELYYMGESFSELLNRPMIAIVGSRKVSPYGRHITQLLASELARAGVVIVSGLALGVDSIAHQAAIDAHGTTVAVLPCGIDTIYPASHFQLARRITREGGVLVSEYAPGSAQPMKYQFIARNRIIAGLSQGILITEAAVKSGSLHTAEFALEQGIDVFAVPGNITSPTSVGTNNLIKHGATPVTTSADILEHLGLSTSDRTIYKPANENEAQILTLIQSGVGNPELLQLTTNIDPASFIATLTSLELSGAIAQTSSGKWVLG